LLVSCRMGAQPTPTGTPYPPTDTDTPTSTPLPATQTATETPIPPTSTVTSYPTQSYIPENALVGAPTPVPGWVTYINDYLGYSINLPSQAKILERGPVGMDVNEVIPPGFTYDEYFDYVMDILPDKLCVSIDIPGAFITIVPPYHPLGSYIGPCPGMGIGSQYRIEPAHETLFIAGREYTDVQGDKLYIESTGAFDFEFYVFDLENDFRLIWSGGPRDELSYDSYLTQRSVVMEIIATLHWYRAPDLTKPGTTCAGAYTRLVPSVYAAVAGGSDDPPNRVRSGPSTADEIISQIYPQTVVKIIEGPVCTDGLIFWRVVNALIPGGSGWTAEGDGTEYWLEPYQP
jgi:hypothetical protein